MDDIIVSPAEKQPLHNSDAVMKEADQTKAEIVIHDFPNDVSLQITDDNDDLGIGGTVSSADTTIVAAETIGSEMKSTSNIESNMMSSALSQLLEYGMSDSDDSSSDSENSVSSSDSDDDSDKDFVVAPETSNFAAREQIQSDSSSDSSSSSCDCDSSSSSDSDTENELDTCKITKSENVKRNTKKMTFLKTKGELSLDDLPPIEDLRISVPEDECIQIGHVSSIVERLVLVQANKGTPAFDIDTLLFLDNGQRPLGKIFDVMGPVTEPFYAVRFNSSEQAIATGVTAGTPVFCAPRTSHTAYVFLNELMRMKGSDASWEQDNEPPENCLDYSDDEEERRAKKKDRQQIPHNNPNKSNSLERNKKFEKRMNVRNMQMNQNYSAPSTSAFVPRPGFNSQPPRWPPVQQTNVWPPSFTPSHQPFHSQIHQPLPFYPPNVHPQFPAYQYVNAPYYSQNWYPNANSNVILRPPGEHFANERQ